METSIIKCENCGGAAYSDMQKEGFLCPYCGKLMPWGAKGRPFSMGIRYRHMQPKMKDGWYQLAVLGEPVRNSDVSEFILNDKKMRFQSIRAKLANADEKALIAWNSVAIVTIACRQCGAEVKGSSAQSVFVCEYCGNRFAGNDALSGRTYNQELVLGRSRGSRLSEAIPFNVSRDQAKNAIMEMVRENPKKFDGQMIAERIDSELQAVYLPYRLGDIWIVAQAQTERGRVQVYQGRTNWALPMSWLYDRYLVNILHPWDFDEVASFRPTFLEEEVMIVSDVMNDDKEIRGHMLIRDLPDMVCRAFDTKKAKILWVLDYLRLHNHARIMLPVWYLDKHTHNEKLDPVVARLAVNGQTGSVAALFYGQGGSVEKYIVKLPHRTREMSGESSLFSQPVPVVKKHGSISYYKPVSFKEALQK